MQVDPHGRVIERERTSDPAAEQFLIFKIGPQYFGMPTCRVRGIMSVRGIGGDAPGGALKGAVKLRGRVIPVVSLRVKLGLAEVRYTRRTCIVVARIQSAFGPLLAGLIVDSLCEVLNLKVRGERTHLKLGVVRAKGRPRTLLDIDHILTAEEAEELHALLYRPVSRAN